MSDSDEITSNKASSSSVVLSSHSSPESKLPLFDDELVYRVNEHGKELTQLQRKCCNIENNVKNLHNDINQLELEAKIWALSLLLDENEIN